LDGTLKPQSLKDGGIYEIAVETFVCAMGKKIFAMGRFHHRQIDLRTVGGCKDQPRLI
jgi:hypothetical protein